MCSQDTRNQETTQTTYQPRQSSTEVVVEKQRFSGTIITEFDVYCGRDKRNHSHPGNKRFRDLIQANRDRYQNAALREYKTRITSDIIDMVHSYGGRFLRLDEASNTWYQVDGAYIHDKVSHALRSARDPLRPKVQKKRLAKIEGPTAAEDEAFWRLVAKQEKFYKELSLQPRSIPVLNIA